MWVRKPGVRDGWELPNAGTRNWTGVFCKSSKHSYLLSPLPSLQFVVNTRWWQHLQMALNNGLLAAETEDISYTWTTGSTCVKAHGGNKQNWEPPCVLGWENAWTPVEASLDTVLASSCQGSYCSNVPEHKTPQNDLKSKNKAKQNQRGQAW